jgi:phosphopantothenoylcysteine decarboxylase/phosphopantothenate--cysteine ligase
MQANASILLIITGSVAAYKALELIRELKARDISVTTILTKGAQQFITPMAVSSLSGTHTYTDLFSLTDEIDMGHIELSRAAEHVLVAPASADIMAKMAAGIADDLATTALLATNKPITIAPAMNVKMWEHDATQANLATLKQRGVRVVMPKEGSMACGEFGMGRLADVQTIADAISHPAAGMAQPLSGKYAIVTAGPTHEAVDPVRYIGNHASGKQGYAIAEALAQAGATVTLVSGPTHLIAPKHVTTIHVTRAQEMHDACMGALPADIFIGCAAVADWHMPEAHSQKMKKHASSGRLSLELVPTPDILATMAAHTQRPALVVGFAAETEDVERQAQEKRVRKKCDIIIANSVAHGAVFGDDTNEVMLIRAQGTEHWPRMEKPLVAKKLVATISDMFAHPEERKSA